MQDKAADSIHLRVIDVYWRYFERLLNLPEGFRVIQAQQTSDMQSLSLLILCPPKPEYEVKEWEHIPHIADTTYHTNSLGIVDKLWHPGLGQEEPTDTPISTYIELLENKVLEQGYDLTQLKEEAGISYGLC